MVDRRRPAPAESTDIADVESGAPSPPIEPGVRGMDPRKLYSGLALLPLLVSGPIFANFSKGEDGRYPYNSTVAVLAIETLKFIIGLVLYLREFGMRSPVLLSGYASTEEFLRKSLYFSIPALIYAIANNLVFVGLQYLDPGVFQLLNNLKILSTAVLSRLFLSKKLSSVQWTALLVLTCGAAVSQLPTSSSCPSSETTGDGQGASRVSVHSPADVTFGVIMSLLLTLCSGIAGVWTEYVMKGRGVVRDQPIQLQNMQLYVYGAIVNLLFVWFREGPSIFGDGLFTGFGFWAWIVVINQCFMGFSVSYLMKYADNIVKVFINCVAMLIVAVLSTWLFASPFTAQLFLSIVLVAASIALYNL